MAVDRRHLDAGERARRVLPKTVRVLLEVRGESLAAAAEAIDLSPASFSERMTGKTRMSIDEAAALADFLQVEPGVLFEAPERLLHLPDLPIREESKSRELAVAVA